MNIQDRIARNNYLRSQWAYSQEEAFRNELEHLFEDFELLDKQAAINRACDICMEDLWFRYPAEHRLAEIISTEDTYDYALDQAKTLMKKYRLGFLEYRAKES